MTRHLEIRGRDTVLQEKKKSQRLLIPLHSQHHALWEKVVGYFAQAHRAEPNKNQADLFQKVDANRNQNDLELIFTKLQDCCDEGETELKDAIKYGLKIMSIGKHHRGDSMHESSTENENLSRYENHSSQQPPLA